MHLQNENTFREAALVLGAVIGRFFSNTAHLGLVESS